MELLLIYGEGNYDYVVDLIKSIDGDKLPLDYILFLISEVEELESIKDDLCIKKAYCETKLVNGTNVSKLKSKTRAWLIDKLQLDDASL